MAQFGGLGPALEALLMTQRALALEEKGEPLRMAQRISVTVESGRIRSYWLLVRWSRHSAARARSKLLSRSYLSSASPVKPRHYRTPPGQSRTRSVCNRISRSSKIPWFLT